MRTGGEILAQALAVHGVDRVFCVAGESYLPVLDALLAYPGIEIVTCRHESGATFMAEAYANLTGKPVVAMVTRGPGACNGAIGIHTAKQSSTPLILLVGLINQSDQDKEAFQEFDVTGMFASISKWSCRIDQTARMGEYVARAFHVATSGRAGPVVLGLPEDLLFAKDDAKDVTPIILDKRAPTAQSLHKIRDVLSQAKRPVIIAGGALWSDEACADLAAFSSASHLPVSTSFRRQDLFMHSHGNYIGELGSGPNPALLHRVKSADVLLVMGARLNEMATQEYSLFQPGQKIIHVYPDADAFGRAYTPHLAIEADPGLVVAGLAGEKPLDGRSWAAWRDEGRADYIAWTTIPENGPDWQGADMTQIFKYLQENLPQDSIVTTDAGNFSGWCQRYLHYGRPGRLLAPISGAMGYAVPSVIAASIASPDVISVGFCGDGGFMMSASEIATAMHQKAKPIIIVCNNSMYGTIRMHQDKHYPGRPVATDLTNPDFVKMAESYGAYAARVTDAKDFPAVWQGAVKADTAALIEIQMDPRQLKTTSEI